MREAVGGTWLLYFFFVFIFVYVVFIAVIMNYASAYRTNNYVISTLEENEGNVDWNTIKDDIKGKFSYTNKIGYCCSPNYNNGVVYRIETYVSFEIPLIGTNFNVPITTDSKTIYDGVCGATDRCK